MRAFITSITILVATLSAAAQKATSDLSPPPGAIHLPEGFRHERLQGIDTEVGRISKAGGLIIEYDIGRLAGNYAKQVEKGDRQWTIEQTINGQPVMIVKSKDGKVTATFAKLSANFWAKVSGEEDLAAFLAIVLTYPGAPAEK